MPGHTPGAIPRDKGGDLCCSYGSVVLTLDGISQLMDVGDVGMINPGARHKFMTEVGAVVEEISSTHYRADSYYSDPAIGQNANRKSIVKVNL